MPRRGLVVRRPVEPDPKYNSELLSRFVSRVMQQGKKSLARRIVYAAFDVIEKRHRQNPFEVFNQAVRNATPVLEVRPRRVGGATYQIPIEIRGDRRQALAIRWLIQAASGRPGKSLAEKLAAELWDAAQNTGGAVKKREDTHRMAEANKAFAHYRW
ncbi:MAG: 30S ribosomal protein S7 [Chloroflexi bacterium]|nr:30S ribosomal protein S7 [Chloroflexota bacterium]